MILSRLKFPVSNRQNKPCLHQEQYNVTGACLYSRVSGSEEPKPYSVHWECAPSCSHGCTILHATGVHQELISQLSFPKRQHIWALRDLLPIWIKAQQVSFASKSIFWICFQKSLNPNISSNTHGSQTAVWMQKVSRDHLK